MSLTEMVIMPGADYQQTCDAIREKTGGMETIKSGQLPRAVADVFLAGKQASDEAWGKRVYTAFVRGSGTNNISVDLPFEPDFVTLGLFDPFAIGVTYSYWGLVRDFKTFARLAGTVQRSIDGTAAQTTSLNNNTVGNYIKYEDGKLSFVHPSNFDSRTVWNVNSRYLLTALKYTEDGKSDADILKDYIRGLSDSGGTVTISNRRFSDTGMTESEFNAFTAAHKPNWTFVFS